MGECPSWYSLIQAAKYLGCTPWELLQQPIVWREWAAQAGNAEAEAEKQRQASQNRKTRRGR